MLGSGIYSVISREVVTDPSETKRHTPSLLFKK